MTTRRAQGIDISAWQKEFNPTNKRKRGIDFIVLRTSKNRTKDPKFEDFYLESLNYPVRGAYHYFTTAKTESSYLIPGNEIKPEIYKSAKHKKVYVEGVLKYVKRKGIKTTHGSGAKWQEQADLFLNWIKGKDFHFLALDIEGGKNPKKYIGQTKNIFTPSDVENMEQWIDYVRKAAKIPVLVYTRPVFLRDKLIPLGGEKLRDMDLWLAAYGKDGEVVDAENDNPYKRYPIPGVSQSHWHLWQYSADKNGLGSEFGVKTSGIDLDVFNGTLEDMKDWLAGKGFKKETGAVDEPEMPAPVENQIEWIITQLEKLVAAGITPAVEINIGGTLLDVEKLKTLKESLEKEGIDAEVNLSLNFSSNGNLPPRNSAPTDNTQLLKKTPPNEGDPSPSPLEGIKVRAFSKKKAFVPLWVLSNRRDGVGKPGFDKTNPVIRIPVDEQFYVSTTHKISDKDKDGKIKADDGNLYYYINDYSENGDVVGKYVKKDDVKRV